MVNAWPQADAGHRHCDACASMHFATCRSRIEANPVHCKEEGQRAEHDARAHPEVEDGRRHLEGACMPRNKGFVKCVEGTSAGERSDTSGAMCTHPCLFHWLDLAEAPKRAIEYSSQDRQEESPNVHGSE